MRLADIEIGEYYAVSVNPKQVDVDRDLDDERRFSRGQYMLDRAQGTVPGLRAAGEWAGYRARVLGIEPNERGRKLVESSSLGGCSARWRTA